MAMAFVEGLGWVEQQTKAVDITENGTTEIIPDRGMVLNSVMVNTNVQTIDPDEYVKKTDYATRDTAGVVKSDDRYGTRMVNGVIDIIAANKNVIDSRTVMENPLYATGSNNRHSIVAANIDYAVKKVLIDHKIELTDAEKSAALAWLGLGDLMARIEALEKASVSTFVVQIGGVSYVAEEGMTWSEWVTSKYNTAGAYEESGCIWLPDGGSGYSPTLYYALNPVSPTDVIDSSGEYDYVWN